MSCDFKRNMALHAANPLLRPLGPYIETWAGWIELISSDPLKHMDQTALTHEQRIMLLDDIGGKFEPTRISLDIVADLQDMIRTSLRSKNPLLSTARIKQNALLATLSTSTRLDTVPWFNTPLRGKMIFGVTGLGKTHAVQRFIDIFPRIHIHEDGDIPGWKKFTQIISLYVKMTHDGYRRGFLQAILISVDELCKTNYCTQYQKERIETLAVRVGQILISHHVGLLIIDDLQVKNFSLSSERDLMLLLFLKLLDFGIPVVLIGSPLAFVDIESFSQDNRRLTTSEPAELMPYDSLEDADWGKGLIPSIWKHNIMPTPTPLTAEIAQLLHENSAGFTHYLMIITVGVQRYALRRGLKEVTTPILREYIDQSRTLKSAGTLLQGFKDKDPFQLSSIEDVPWQEYGIRWGKIKPEEIINTQPPNTSKGANKPEVRMRSLQQRAAMHFINESKKRENKEKTVRAIAKHQPKEDIRNAGVGNYHIPAIRKLQEDSS